MFFYDWTMILLIPAMIFAFYAQTKVSSAYRRYSKIQNRSGMSGAQAARRILDMNGMRNVPIELVAGELTDHYDPTKKVMRLSQGVYHNTSIAAVSIAAHEAGHAIQHATGYSALKIRNSMVPVVNFASTLSWPLLIIGLLLGSSPTGTLLFNLGILFFLGVVLFHGITLPVELNASRRAVEQMKDLQIIHSNEIGGAKKVLSAAAMTYLAALAMAVANLLRMLLLRGEE